MVWGKVQVLHWQATMAVSSTRQKRILVMSSWGSLRQYTLGAELRLKLVSMSRARGSPDHVESFFP